MRIIIINLITISLLIILSELTVRILKISQVQGVERNLFNLEGEIVLNQSNTEAVIFGKKAYIDKYGFRVPKKNYDYEYNTSLLILGDSVSFGVGIQENKTFPGILRKKLKTNIYNASVAGHNLSDYSILIKDYHNNFDDISRIFVFICLNDVHFSKGIVKNIEFEEKKNELFYVKILRKVNVYLRNKSALFVFLKSKFTKSDERHFNLLDDYYKDPNILKKYKDIIYNINSFSISENLKVNYVMLPYSFQIKNNCNSEVLLPQKKIKKIFSDLNIEIYDLTNKFCEESEKKLFLNYDPVHLSEDGHKLVSESIIKKIY